MFLRRCSRRYKGRRHSYWTLVESVRTARGPRQQVVAYLGDLDESGRLELRDAALAASGESVDVPPPLFSDDTPVPRFAEIDTSRVRVEHLRSFGGEWLALHLIDRLGLRVLL